MTFGNARGLCFAFMMVVGCSAGVSDGTGTGGSTASQGSGGGATTGAFGTGSGGSCALQCTTDLHAVIDCSNNVVATCSGLEGCDSSTGTCTNACQAAETNKLSVGCDYYATAMDQILTDACFAAFVTNTWNTPVHIQAEWNGMPISVAQSARIPSGSGQALQYNPYDPVAGLAPGQVAILFLAGGSSVPCPVPAAVPTGAQILSTDIGHSFHIMTDVPVVTYQINPYGGGSAQTTAASLLLPTSVWDTNYVAVNISPFDIANPSLNIVARDDNTTVTLLPKQPVMGGGAVPPMPANQASTVMLMHGENLQISQQAELTGSIIQSDKPIGFMAGQNCMRAPVGTPYCDHGEQMIPPVKALGSEYAGVMYRPRVPAETQTIWKLVGAVNGTQLTWSSPVGGPATLDQGQLVEFNTGTPFVVSSQDSAHPFVLMTYMSSNGWVPGMDGYGDPDLVISVPPAQYLNRYVFFADPTYPESNLVVVRAKNGQGTFSDVTLDCFGPLTGWQPVGEYEWTRFDLQTGNFTPNGNCSTGAHEMKSDGRFGLWVWGWGTPETSTSTRDVSYGYPGGMNALPINQVVIPPIPN